jgi:hypothetical protein
MDDETFANLVHRGCNPAMATAIVADLGWVVVDAAAEPLTGGKGGGGTTMGGRGGSIKGGQRIIIVVVVNADGNGSGVDGGRVEGSRVKDGSRRRWMATRLLLPGGEGGRKCTHQGVGNIKNVNLKLVE